MFFVCNTFSLVQSLAKNFFFLFFHTLFCQCAVFFLPGSVLQKKKQPVFCSYSEHVLAL